MQTVNSVEHCYDCMSPFVRSAVPRSANPRSESPVDPGLCLRCSVNLRREGLQPMPTFAETVKKMWTVGAE